MFLKSFWNDLAYKDTIFDFHMFNIISVPILILTWLHFPIFNQLIMYLADAANRCFLHQTEMCSFNSFDL